MAPEPLKVDTERLAAAGQRFLEAANAIPEAPMPYVPTSTDALSAAIADQAAKVMAPVVEGLRALKANATKFAETVIEAARTYQGADDQHADDIDQRASGMRPPGSGAGGTSGGGGAGAATAGPGGAGQLGELSQFGQMMQLPMEMAGQAAQLPMPLDGIAGMLPQSLMQGVPGPVQEGGQISQMSRLGGGSPAGEAPPGVIHPAGQHSLDPADPDDTADGAAAGQPSQWAPDIGQRPVRTALPGPPAGSTPTPTPEK
jgi:hypothetical protein